MQEPKIAVYGGSFDPVTRGHLDIIERGARIFDQVIVAVLINMRKEHVALFTVEERIKFISEATRHLPNVVVDGFPGLFVNYLKEKNVHFIIRGLRAVSDFESELQLASMNRELDPLAETIFIPTHHEYSYLSSSIVKEIALHGGNVEQFVPGQVNEALKIKYREYTKEHYGQDVE